MSRDTQLGRDTQLSCDRHGRRVLRGSSVLGLAAWRPGPHLRVTLACGALGSVLGLALALAGADRSFADIASSYLWGFAAGLVAGPPVAAAVHLSRRAGASGVEQTRGGAGVPTRPAGRPTGPPRYREEAQ